MQDIPSSHHRHAHKDAVLAGSLHSQFLPVLDSLSAGPDLQPGYMEGYAPYNALPWVSNTSTREEWIREEASWRTLPLASSSGRLVQRLQRVNATQNYNEDDVGYITGGYVEFRLRAPETEYGFIEKHLFPLGLPLGLLYDMMVPDYDSVRTEWKMLFETRVKDPHQFDQFCRALCSVGGPEYVSVDEIKGYLAEDRECALMMIVTSERWARYNGPKREGLWEPEQIGDAVDTYTHFYMEAPTS
jgi:hypothetical protein